MRHTLVNLRIGIMLVLTVLLTYLVMRLMKLPPVGVDDANILFVYSKHFAAGEGLVYNIGGERVEGFSSMAWMLLTSVGYLFTEFPYPLFLALNVILLGSVLGYLLHLTEVRYGHGSGDARLPVSLAGSMLIVWLVANPSYFLWTTVSLMETGLWSALLIVSAMYLLEQCYRETLSAAALRNLSALMALLVLTRPEGIAWVMSFVTLLALIQRSRGDSWAAVLRGAGKVALAAGVVYGALIAGRLLYFGFPQPNTYYVKVTPDRLYNLRFGVIYLWQFIQAQPLAVPLIAAAAFSFLRNLVPALTTLFAASGALTGRRLAEFSLAGIVLVGMLLPVLMGGDIFGAFRFYQPVWPLLILTLFALPLPERLWRPANATVVVAVTLAALVALTYSNLVRWPSLSEDRAYVKHLFQLSERHMLSGQYLHRLFDEYERGLPSLGVSAAGGHKIGYRGEVLDTMGLNYLAMAHHDGDKKGTRGHAAFSKAVWWQNPTDFFEPTLCPLKGPPVNRYKETDNWMYEIYRGMPGDDDFNARYRFVALDVPDTDDRVCGYVSNEWLAALEADGFGFTVVD